MGAPLRLIVAGGRDYSDRAAVFAVLDRIHPRHGDTLPLDLDEIDR